MLAPYGRVLSPYRGGVAMIDGSAEPLADTRHLHRAPSKTLCGLDAARIQLLRQCTMRQIGQLLEHRAQRSCKLQRGQLGV